MRKSVPIQGACFTIFFATVDSQRHPIVTVQLSGALSSLGKDKSSILTMMETALANISTFGIALTPCSLPGSKANFSLADDEMELGLGIHGENGIGRTKVNSFLDGSL